MMDEEFADLPCNPTDSNIYSFGRIGNHNVVAACLPAGQMGTNQAAVVASHMNASFPSLRFGVLVGIGGGVPNLDADIDIRLGDVVISQAADYYANGRVARTGSLNAPPRILFNALAKLRANDFRDRTQVVGHLSKLFSQPKFASPGPENDMFYEALLQHKAGATCVKCRPEDMVDRETRTTTDPRLFFGTIASGNQVMKDGLTRDRYSRELGGVLCFEMEAAGLMNSFPCIVVRGICDYADAHKNKRWQPYAAAIAAACAKELFSVIPREKVLEEKLVRQLIPTGPAGTGKSTIARTVADTFFNEKRLVAGYFFKRGERGRNDTTRLFPTLAAQLAETIPHFKSCLQKSVGGLDRDAVEKKGLAIQFEKLLWLPLGDLPRTDANHGSRIIIIDALDECEQPEHLPLVLSLLSKLRNILTVRLRILCTSRSAPKIANAFRLLAQEKAVYSLELHRVFSEDTKNDIQIFLKTKFAQIKRDCNVDQNPWPTVNDLDRMVQLATTPEPLFIYAATLCRFVYDEKRPCNPKKQLKSWLKQCEDGKSQLHQIYDPVLSQVFLGNEEAESGQQLQFLGAIVLLATPLPATSLTVLLGLDVDDVNWWLPELHAVLEIPPEPHRPIRLLHKSFSDFLLSSKDSGISKHYIDAAETHGKLAARCIKRMKAGLKRDICDIRKPDGLRDKIDKQMMDTHIPADLQYACVYWVYHLQQSEGPVGDDVYVFLCNHLLNWLEVLAILGKVSDGAAAMKQLLAMRQPTIAPENFTVGWICALPIELAAAAEMMDEEFADLPCNPTDSNIYSFGRIGNHNVVAACLPAGQMGTNQAAVVASHMNASFPSLRFGVLVGIGGGVPNLDADIDIRLGDVVISQAADHYGGVVQYDFGKTGADGRVARTGSLNAPPRILLNALAKLRANDFRDRTQVVGHLSKLSSQPKFASPGPENDMLYEASSQHKAGATCVKCRPEDMVDRETRTTTDPRLFFGTIASGNQVMKDGLTRDRYSRELGGVLCFEMEAAGLMNSFPCIVVRGICDYADAHKNKRWQPYAAATAAACAKELLSVIPREKVLEEKLVRQLIPIAEEQLHVSIHQRDIAAQQLAELQLQSEIIKDRPVDLPIVFQARYDSTDIQESPRCESQTRFRVRETIHNWADECAEPLFWLAGPAGTGKSTIARTVADTFFNEKRLVAGYFFKRGERGRNDTTRLFPTLAAQLAETIPHFKSCLQKSVGGLDRDAVEKKGLAIQFEKLLWLPLGDLPRTDANHGSRIIIIDALDECEQPEHLPLVLSLLSKLRNILTVRLRILCTSRSAPKIANAFRLLAQEKAVYSLELHRVFSEDTKNDIQIFLKTKFAQIKRDCNVDQNPWPTVNDLDRMVQLATTPEPLFIYAATLCRFVYDEKRPCNPKKQLKSWLKQCEDGKSQLHQIYDPVLSQVFLGNEEAESGQQLQFLGAIVLLATPLPATSLTVLLGLDVDDVNWWLPELHAVLEIPPEPHRPIRLLHKSFSDFLLSSKDSGISKHYIDAAETHGKLAARCIKRMKAGLKRDICDIRKPDGLRDKIDKQMMDTHIPADLQYACVYWVYHLQQSEGPVGDDVYVFLCNHLLNWLEVLAILGKVSDGAAAMKQLLAMRQAPNAPGELSEFIKDASKVIAAFGSIIE
ncbi:uncharacterized protein PgNI_12229, partial [Pyricularia grisea]|uniref:Nephrocystin 3-like N-terminal domain-containing protein n=1 Tax=Pyricularia grisea TaxID=148305 RepID=A0A6P8AMT5_PYRGI